MTKGYVIVHSCKCSSIYKRKLFGVAGDGGVDEEFEICPVFNLSLLVSGVSNNLWNLEMADWFKEWNLVFSPVFLSSN